MGVTGLWTVVQPCARPVKIETLNKKRLAIDASIWIYQFLKAVRDKEGHALRNSHVVGFFRRICKLLFIGIQPVFVFDGGAPALKRQTIASRKQRREGRREDATRTAGKLLAVQLQRRAEEEDAKRREEEARSRPARPGERVEEEVPENPVYVEQIYQTPQERQQSAKKFRKTDQYHLPELDMSLSEMGGPDDLRVMSLEELHEYARNFSSGEDINLYDFSKIDFDGTFFQSLPATDRYNILNAARLRSRLRMGYSKDQLDTMFPDRMAFSKFQIDRVRERNELTQRLMHINGMNESGMSGVGGVNRISGEKGREYVLVKNDGVEGGWALGVVTNDEGKYEKPIDVDLPESKEEDSEEQSEEDFEDVPISGLNRLPKQREADRFDQLAAAKELAARRKAIYNSRQAAQSRRKPAAAEADDNDESLFVADEADEWEDVPMTDNLRGQGSGDEEDEDLQRAIAMSLDKEGQDAEDEDDDYMEVFQQSRVEEANPFSKGSGLAIAHVANSRSRKAAPNPFTASDSEDEGVDLQKALAESRRTKRKPASTRPMESRSRVKEPSKPVEDPAEMTAKAHGFDGPLPFEKLNFGSSLLGKKKAQQPEQEDEDDTAGGFVKPGEGSKKKKEALPLPPWFSDNTEVQQTANSKEDEAKPKDRNEDSGFVFEDRANQRNRLPEIVNLDDEKSQEKDVIAIDSDEDAKPPSKEEAPADPNLRMGDIADAVKAAPPPSATIPAQDIEETHQSGDELFEWDESDNENISKSPPRKPTSTEQAHSPAKSPTPEFEDVLQPSPPKSPSLEFEDVPISQERPQTPEDLPGEPMEEDEVIPMSGVADQNMPVEDDMEFSDPEEEQLMLQMAEEAEEHARFTSSLNQQSTVKESFDYDKELKSLRLQQRKDLRDADEVTTTMISECQHLLSLFGLPYITAPMEAEAQCAELVNLGLVDGIVTDDSDIFLFGGNRVYKNMFNQAKFVECYLSSDLSSEFGLTRENLIACAELLGSDYTTGLPGVGPVTAVELLGEFGSLDAFVTWFTAVQRGEIPAAHDKAYPVRRKFRRAHATKLFLPTAFPDPRVRDAYLHPQTDTDPEAFRWGVPDLKALRRFLSSTVGWSEERTDEVLVPVVRDMNRREAEGTQANITRFFDGNVGAGAFAPRRREEIGARLGNALSRIGARARREEAGVVSDEVPETEEVDEPPVSRGKKAAKGAKGKRAARKEPSVEVSDGEDESGYEEKPRKKARKGTKGSAKGKKGRAGD